MTLIRIGLLILLIVPAPVVPGQGLYRVDLANLGSCYDADLFLMLDGHVFAYLDRGAIEVSFAQPPAGIKPREKVVLLGIRADLPQAGSRYIADAILGRDVLLAFDSSLRGPDGALLAYVYLPGDGTCVNLKLVREGWARVAPADVPFQFRQEFQMYEQRAREKHLGIWAGEPPGR